MTYDANGSTGGTVPIDPAARTPPGRRSPCSATPVTWPRPGYTFAGWNTAANGTGTAYAPGATFTITANTTLYAQWTALPTYTVTYDANGGTGGDDPADRRTVTTAAT